MICDSVQRERLDTISLTLSHRSFSPPPEVDVGNGGHTVGLEEPLHATERDFCRGNSDY